MIPISTPTFRLRLLGGVALERAGAPWDGLSSQKKALALLALLALSGDRGLSRDKVVAYLWPEADLERARNALSQLIFRCRRELGTGAVTGNGDLRIDPAIVACDATEFLAALRQGRHEMAAALYQGAFLDGFFIREAAEFERWAAAERERLERAVLPALEHLAGDAESRGDDAKAAEWRRRQAELQPLSGQVVRRYMEALIADGSLDAALRVGSGHVSLVRAELQAEADPDVVRLVAELRAGSIAPRARREATPVAGAAPPSAVPDIPSAPDTRSPPSDSRATGTRMFSRGTARRLGIVGCGAAGLLALGLGLRRASAPHIPVVMVPPFENSTGDTSIAGLGRVASTWVSEGLARTGMVAVIDTRGNVPGLEPQQPQHDARRADWLSGLIRPTATTAVVNASFYRRGDSVEFIAAIHDAATGRVVRALAPLRAGLRDPGAGLAELSSRVDGAVASMIDRRAATLIDASAPPPRFEAFREYVDGLDEFTGIARGHTNYAAAAEHFARAVQLDTAFVTPYVWMELAWGNVGLAFQFGHFGRWRPAKEDSIIAALEMRRDRLSTIDRRALDFFIAHRRGDEEAAYASARAAAELAPRSVWTYLTATFADALGRPAEAIDAFRQFDPEHDWIRNWAPYWRDYASALHAAGRFDDQLKLARRGARQSTDPFALRGMIEALGAQGDAAAIDRLSDSLETSVSRSFPFVAAGAWLNLAAMEAQAHGRDAAAARIRERCIRWDHAHAPAAAEIGAYELYLNKLAGCLYAARRWDEADAVSDTASRFPPIAADATILRVLIAAQRGDSDAFRRRLDEAYDRPTFAAGSVGRNLLDGRLALLRRDPSAAAASLRSVDNRTLWSHLPELTPEMRETQPIRNLLMARTSRSSRAIDR